MRKTIFLSFFILILVLGGCGKKGEDTKAPIEPLDLNGEWNIFVTIEDYKLGPPPLETAQTEDDAGCDLRNINLDMYNTIKEWIEENAGKPQPAKMYIELDSAGKGFAMLLSEDDEYGLLDDEDKEDLKVPASFDGRILHCFYDDAEVNADITVDVEREGDGLAFNGSFAYDLHEPFKKEDGHHIAGILSGVKKDGL